MRLDKIDNLEDVRQWIYGHDARSEERGEYQGKANESIDQKLASINIRLSALERRVIWISAVFSAGGAAGGSFFF